MSRSYDPTGWISDEATHKRFLGTTVNIVASPMNLNLSMSEKEGFMFPDWLERQGLSIFVQMKGYWYPELVKVFYHNLRVVEDNIHLRVKGVDIQIDEFMWNIITNLPSKGAFSHLPSTQTNTLLNKRKLYKDWLRFPGIYSTERFFAYEGLMKEEKIVAYLLALFILPGRIRNDRMTREDIYLLHGIKNNIPINWLRVVKDHMKNAALNRSLYLPYVVFISKVLVLLGVDIKNEQKRLIGTQSCLWEL